MNNPNIDIAKIFGQPIDSTLPVPAVISEISEFDTCPCGEDAYYFDDYDDNVDTIYTAGDSGEVTSNKKSPIGATPLTLLGYQTDLAYITLNELSGAKDLSALARKKSAITRSMDKHEVKSLLDIILGITSQRIICVSGEDLYDGILKMVHLVADYGDNFVLLCGTTVWEKINTYDKENANNFNYRISIKEFLAESNIKIVKVTGNVKLDSGSYDPVLAATKAILVARNSTIVDGKPCLLVRRLFSEQVSKDAGLDNLAQRLTTTIGGLQVINNSKNILGYGVVGYENFVTAVTNYKAIAFSDDLNI